MFRFYTSRACPCCRRCNCCFPVKVSDSQPLAYTLALSGLGSNSNWAKYLPHNPTTPPCSSASCGFGGGRLLVEATTSFDGSYAIDNCATYGWNGISGCPSTICTGHTTPATQWVAQLGWAAGMSSIECPTAGCCIYDPPSGCAFLNVWLGLTAPTCADYEGQTLQATWRLQITPNIIAQAIAALGCCPNALVDAVVSTTFSFTGFARFAASPLDVDGALRPVIPLPNVPSASDPSTPWTAYPGNPPYDEWSNDDCTGGALDSRITILPTNIAVF